MKKLSFSKNWNNKLGCQAFTTIRRSFKSAEKEVLEIILNGEFVCYGRIESIEWISIDEITDRIAFVDTGFDAEKTKKLLSELYKGDLENVFIYTIRKVTKNLFGEWVEA